MPKYTEYVGVLRCQTWNTWPNLQLITPQDFPIPTGGKLAAVRIGIVCYEQRPDPEFCKEEDTRRGPLLWNDKISDLHRRHDLILMAPEDQIPIELTYRHAHRGEIDICVNFLIDGELTDGIIDMVRGYAFSTISLLNLQLQDHLIPSLSFQVSQVTGRASRTGTTTIKVLAQTRHDVVLEQAHSVINDFSALIASSIFAKNLIVALELYAAHFNEQQARVRFLLLVIAMEAMTKPLKKHNVAQKVIDRWEKEVIVERDLHANDTEEYKSLEALCNELKHRRDDSIRSQVRRLFIDCASSPDESAKLQKRALHVYDNRSKLVHEGHLPDEELTKMENEARDLLQILFRYTIKNLEAKA